MRMRRTYKFVLAAALLLGVWLLLRIWQGPILEAFSYSREVFDRDGRLIRVTLSGDEKYRIYTPLKDMPPAMIEAVLLHEDRYFRLHPGVNPWSLAKAAVHTYWHQTRRIGGSTITMQLARMTSTRGSKTLSGKLIQIARALQLEMFHSKDEILEAYLNLLPYGSNIEGVAAASRIYFNKTAAKLTLPEILNLALIPQNPNLRSIEAGSEAGLRFRRARSGLLKAWLARHPEDQDVRLDLDLPLNVRRTAHLPFKAPHFSNLVLDKTVAMDWRKRGHVVTTLDRGIQEMVELKLRAYVNAQKRVGIRNASAMVVNHETMEVVAMIGSADFFDSEIEGQVNGTLGKRSPGSSLKPFTYALALDQGLIHTLTLLKDTPMSFGGFDPENFDKSFKGPVNATEALTQSRNVPAVYLTSLLKAPSLYEFFKSAGVSGLKEPKFYGLSLALGGAEVTMEEVVRLYAMLANRGELKNLRYVKSEPTRTQARLLSPEAAFLTLAMLRTNPRDDQKQTESMLRDSVPVAWKTGTSHGFRDAWTTGIVGPYVISVWLGNFNGDGNPALVGRELAAPLFFSIVDGLKSRTKGGPTTWLSLQGLNVKKVKVCSISGRIPGQHCHQQTEAWFIPGKSPIAKCDIHREILISQRTGRRACDESRGDLKREVFEFWPSDLLQIFRVAGIPRKTPPAFEPGCKVAESAPEGLAPNIVSPRKEVVYSMRVTDGREPTAAEIVPLAAVADGGVKQLHWFIGSEYLGRTEPHKPFLWKPRPGRYVVRVIDDFGRSDSRVIDIKVTR